MNYKKVNKMQKSDFIKIQKPELQKDYDLSECSFNLKNKD